MKAPDQSPPPGPPPGGSEPPAAPTGLRGRLIARLEERGSYPTWVLLAALAGMFTATFPITILTVSLGSIAREFDARETTVAWVIGKVAVNMPARPATSTQVG